MVRSETWLHYLSGIAAVVLLYILIRHDVLINRGIGEKMAADQKIELGTKDRYTATDAKRDFQSHDERLGRQAARLDHHETELRKLDERLDAIEEKER